MAGTALVSEVTLTNQERGKEYEYRVIAVNKAGESGPSNTVTAGLSRDIAFDCIEKTSPKGEHGYG